MSAEKIKEIANHLIAYLAKEKCTIKDASEILRYVSARIASESTVQISKDN